MDQNLWGPSMWFILHTVAFTYPYNPTEEQKKSCYNFFRSLKDVLPCSVCRKHFARNWVQHPIQLQNRKALCEWVVLVHNEINSRCGKREMNMKDIIQLYEEKYQTNIYLTERDEKNKWKNYGEESKLGVKSKSATKLSYDSILIGQSWQSPEGIFFSVILVGMVVILSVSYFRK